jgi:hypothetical protein
MGTLAHAIPLVAMVVSAGFLGFVASLVLYVMYKDRGPFARENAANSLNIQITTGIVQPRLLPVRPLAAGLDHRPGVHLGQPRRDSRSSAWPPTAPSTAWRRSLLLDRRDPGDGLPRHRDDAVLLRLEGPQRPGVPAPALQQAARTWSTRSRSRSPRC